jgi:hypothetical protein
MGVNIDKTRSDYQVRSIDRAGPSLGHATYFDDSAPLHGHIGNHSRGSAAVEYQPIFNDKIRHGPTLRPTGNTVNQAPNGIAAYKSHLDGTISLR